MAGREPEPATVTGDTPAMSKFEEDVRTLFTDLAELLLKKHRDYGPRNISGSPGGPLNGIRVRLYDKTARIDNLLDNNLQAQNEPLEDAFIDSAVYNAIAVMVMRKQWPAA